MTHCRSASEAPRARCADGSAMLTMVASSAIISWARAMKARVSQRRSIAGPLTPLANLGADFMAPPLCPELARQQTERDGDHDDEQRCQRGGLDAHEENDAEHHRQPDT